MNGITPALIAPACGTIDNARNMMMTYNRGGTARSLKWTQSGEIKKNIEHVLDETDFFYVNIANHSAILTEMRKVRNYIAHKNKGSRKGFSEVVRARYGGNLKIQVGAFLISKKRHTPSNLSRYFTVSKILIDDISKGF